MPILLAATLWTFSGDAADVPMADRDQHGGVHAWLRRCDPAMGGASHDGRARHVGSGSGTLVDADVLAPARATDELLPGIVPAALLMLAFLGKQRGLCPHSLQWP